MVSSNEALADALSGVIGTLVSLWCFYPIERIKTNLQAGKSLSTSLSSGSLSKIATDSNDPDVIQKQIKFYSDLIPQLYRGCLTKSMHATSSSFCYFYFYSWILSRYNNKRRSRIQMRGNNLEPIQPSTRLILSAIAAMLNTVVTLPLDVLSSKRTVESDGDSTDTTAIIDSISEIKELNENKKKMEDAWNSIEKSGDKSPPGLSTSTGSSSSSSSSTVEMVFHEACSRSEELFSLHNEIQDNDNDNNTSIVSTSTASSIGSIVSNNEEYKLRWKERLEQRKSRRLLRKRKLEQNATNVQEFSNNSAENGANTITTSNLAPFTIKATDYIITSSRRWSKLWKGLAPALLLCSNPSIHYTVFDMLKSKILTWKRLRKSRSNHKHLQLSVSEAFVLGLLSKFVATIVTYPLIRAKVMMMVQGDPTPNTESSASTTTISSPSLWSVLKESYYRDGGILGLYKGCDWQLMHTLLKSALMMAIREQITDKSRALFGVGSK